MKIPNLKLSEKIILPIIELIRQDVRTAGMLYQFVIDKLYHE
jgi:hypothetical protein